MTICEMEIVDANRALSCARVAIGMLSHALRDLRACESDLEPILDLTNKDSTEQVAALYRRIAIADTASYAALE